MDRRIHGTHVRSRVPADVVRDIRRRYRACGVRYRGGAITMQQLADEHGMSIAHISRIINEKRAFAS